MQFQFIKPHLQKLKVTNHLFVALLIGTLSTPVIANESLPAGHQVNFSYEEVMQLENDLMELQFAAIAEGESSADVSLKINKMMQKAKTILQNADVESLQTGNYQVSPVYGKNRVISHWRGQQTLTLSAKTDANLDKVLTQLQQPLAFQSMSFTLSNEKRQKAEATLLKTVIEGYQAKASVIAKGFGHQNYRLIKTDIQPHASAPVVRYKTPMVMEARVASSSAPYQEQGNSDVRVRITGSLLLSP
ncbi:SIMPL domain-containing protein [Thiomicrorhabdus indica]|jgi:predicted secreted protein|uniref:SIMPL domain-containing protein n=1 Tax=Thiomicrorhabdus indica TaxID=2267253 RepID=UPI00102DAF7B|nr:SIMPL domain-containing protein [Thiomicrorhabdus indica]